jgi:hypothetical protein
VRRTKNANGGKKKMYYDYYYFSSDQIRWLKDDFKTLQGLYLFLRTNMLRIEKKRKDLLQDLGIITNVVSMF